MKPNLAWDHRKPRRAIIIRLVVGIWLILLTVILLSEGYWGWALLTGAGAVANFGLAWLAYRRNSADWRKGITMNIMSFQSILYIWLAILFVAYASGWVAHMTNRRTRNLSGVSYHTLLILPQSESDLRILVFSEREPSTAC
jgi:peptidoglycan biosynthesis protein MviN/MurJ (putative lipid II flippase)